MWSAVKMTGRREKMLRAMMALMLVAVLATASCAVHFADTAIYVDADEFLWSGGNLPAGAVVLCTFYQRAESSPEWELITGEWSLTSPNVYDVDTAAPTYTVAQDLPWVDVLLPILLAHLLPDDHTAMWYRVDVVADIDGELYEYSCITSEPYWLGRVLFICGARPR